MSINSLNFFLFFFVILLIYWRLNRRRQNYFLLLASYLFYATWDWHFLFLILTPTVIDYYCAIAIANTNSDQKRKFYLQISIFTSLSILFLFKYFNFFTDKLITLLGNFGVSFISAPHLNIIVPLGISYYLFKSMSYTIDVYSKVIKRPETNFSHYALYLSFFPQLVAGPIERAVHFLPQLYKPRTFDWDFFKKSCYLIFWGIFKKCFIADNLAILATDIFSNNDINSGVEIILGAYANIFRIYADFSGYSDIAIGLAGCLGFKTMLNFNLPFFAKSPADIWRRWHITLSTWVRDYLFYYLGGMRARGFRLAVASIITMIVLGFWHGARLAFVYWGAFHGVLLSLQVFMRSFLRRKKAISAGQSALSFKIGLQIFATFNVFALSGLVFFAKSASDLFDFGYKIIFHFKFTPQVLMLTAIFIFYTWVLILIELLQYIKKDHFALLKLSFGIKVFVYFIMFVFLFVCGVTGGRNFVYMGF
jgi:alginate O-acetyltransferase complex protein AlgI